MLDKHAIQLIPSNQANMGFHSQLFTVPKKDGGTQPIINLKKLNSLYRRYRRNILIHLRMDNTTALDHYINKLGGTVSPELNRITKDLWTWCLEREITLQATHLAGALNVTADEAFCVMKDRTDWMLQYVPKPSGGLITSLGHYRWIYLHPD